MISAGTRLVNFMTADLKNVAIPVQQATKSGDRFIFAMTADGKQIPIKCSSITKEDERGVLAKTADGKNIIVKFNVGKNYLFIGGEYSKICNLETGEVEQNLGIGTSCFSSISSEAEGRVYFTHGGSSVYGNSYIKYFSKNDISNFIPVTTNMIYPPKGIGIDSEQNIYSCGYIYTVFRGRNMNSFGKWDGSEWMTLGGEDEIYCNRVTDVAVDLDNNVYIAGDFWDVTIAGMTGQSVYKWNGSSWSSLGAFGKSLKVTTDASGNVYSCYRDEEGKCYVRKWLGGTSWASLGGALSYGGSYNLYDPIKDLYCASDGNLYCAGWFDAIGGVSANFTACWNGSNWEALGGGLDFYGMAITEDKAGKLYISRSTYGSISIALYIWDGTNLTQGLYPASGYAYTLSII